MGIIPDYIIGDLDSADIKTIDYFKDKKTKVIHDTNPDKTDMELAISLAETLSPSEIIILGAIGDRIDHTLANILCLTYIKSDVKAKIVNEKNIIELVEDSIDLNGKKDDIISIVPLTDISDLNYSGLKWNVKDLKTNLGWFGICNKLENDQANISFSKGKILVIRVRG